MNVLNYHLAVGNVSCICICSLDPFNAYISLWIPLYKYICIKTIVDLWINFCPHQYSLLSPMLVSVQDASCFCVSLGILVSLTWTHTADFCLLRHPLTRGCSREQLLQKSVPTKAGFKYVGTVTSWGSWGEQSQAVTHHAGMQTLTDTSTSFSQEFPDSHLPSRNTLSLH